MRKNIKFLMFSAFFFLSIINIQEAIAQKTAKEGINFFHGSLDQALEKAKRENKLVFMDAYATWCGPCKWMERHAFTNQEVGAYFNQHFVSIKMDMEKGEGPKLAEKYKLVAYPTLYFLAIDGKVVKRAVGQHSPNQLLKLAKGVD